MERNVHEKSNNFQTKKLRIATNLFNIMINQNVAYFWSHPHTNIKGFWPLFTLRRCMLNMFSKLNLVFQLLDKVLQKSFPMTGELISLLWKHVCETCETLFEKSRWASSVAPLQCNHPDLPPLTPTCFLSTGDQFDQFISTWQTPNSPPLRARWMYFSLLAQLVPVVALLCVARWVKRCLLLIMWVSEVRAETARTDKDQDVSPRPARGPESALSQQSAPRMGPSALISGGGRPTFAGAERPPVLLWGRTRRNHSPLSEAYPCLSPTQHPILRPSATPAPPSGSAAHQVVYQPLLQLPPPLLAPLLLPSRRLSSPVPTLWVGSCVPRRAPPPPGLALTGCPCRFPSLSSLLNPNLVPRLPLSQTSLPIQTPPPEPNLLSNPNHPVATQTPQPSSDLWRTLCLPWRSRSSAACTSARSLLRTSRTTCSAKKRRRRRRPTGHAKYRRL